MMGTRKYKAHHRNRLLRAIEYASSNGNKQIPKYLVSAANARSRLDAIKYDCLPSSKPSIQSTAAQIQNASIMTSHMTPLAETSTPGVSSAAAVAISGDCVKRVLNRYVPKTSASAGSRNPR